MRGQIALNYQSFVAKLELLLAQYRTNTISATQLIVDAEALFRSEHAQWLAELQTSVTSPQAMTGSPPILSRNGTQVAQGPRGAAP